LVAVVAVVQQRVLVVTAEQETLEQIALRLVTHLLVAVELVVVVQAQVLQVVQAVVVDLPIQDQAVLEILLLQAHHKVTLAALVQTVAVQLVCLAAAAVQLMLEPLVVYHL
jgi:hypothetical protein